MITILVIGAFSFATVANAAIVEEAPPIDGVFSDTTVGGGTIIPLVKFRLVQTTGSDTLSKVGIIITASTTMSQGELSRISLWRESGSRPDIQVDQDTFITGAASTTPLVNGTLIVLEPTTAVSIGSNASEFYIVATTTSSSGLTNGHAFNVQLQANYASTTANLGLGSAFVSNRKITLNQSATIKISEAKIGNLDNTTDQFVELFNSGEADINLRDLPLSLHIYNENGSSSPQTLTYYRTTIPAHGYFLIASQTNYSGNVPPDAVFNTFSGNVLIANGGLTIATSSARIPGVATSTAIDRLGWGNQPSANCENLQSTTTACAAALATNGQSLERVALGYPNATSTAASMYIGGIDSSKGNGFDDYDNSGNFVVQTLPYPQNSFSPVEFPFGGGGQDSSSLQVQGSFPGDNMTGVPIDMSFVGFNFNKPVATTTIISPTATTTITLVKSGGIGSNQCVSVSYNPFPGNYEPQAKCVISPVLTINSIYTFTVTSNVRDLSGNALDQNSFTAGNQNYTTTFTAGGANQTFTNQTPPAVVGTSPFQGSSNVPTNITKIAVSFSQANMDESTLNSSNISLVNAAGASITLSSFSFSTSTGENLLSISLGSSLSANTAYTLSVTPGVRNSLSLAIPGGGPAGAYQSRFTTGTGSDGTGPSVIGVLPTPGTTLTANTNDFIFIFDDNIDATTATSGAITLGIVGGANLPGAVRYDPVAKEGHFTPSNILPLNQPIVLTLKGASIKNIAGMILGSDVTRTWTVADTNSDITGPTIMFANGDDFSLAITFNEALNQTDAVTLSNYSLTIGGVSQTLSSMAGHQLSYDATTRTANLTGLRMASGSSFTVTAQNIKDLSGNAISVSTSFTGSIASYSNSGGFVGPGSFQGSTFGESRDFTSAGIGFMPPVNVRAQGSFVNASTTYEFELPIATRIPADGTIVITFPASSDFGLCCVATSSTRNPFVNEQNKDINGPGSGSVGIKTVAKDAATKAVTLTLDTATRLESNDTHDFLRFSLADVKNPSIPKGPDSSGYTLDIKSKNSSGVLLESFTVNPVFIGGGSMGGGATTTIRGTVSGNGGVLAGVTVHLVSPQSGPMDATTNTQGVYQFSDIPINSQFLQNNFGGGGEYMIFTEPFIANINDANGATTTSFFGESMPTPVLATSTSVINRNFALTSTIGANNFVLKATAAANTFSSTEQIDVFAGGPGKFIVQTVTPGAGALAASTLATIPIPGVNGNWSVGIGPAVPKGIGGPMGPPPSMNWSTSGKPLDIVVSGCPSACLISINSVATTSAIINVYSADKTISGVLRDGSGNAISGAGVFAYSPDTGMGNNSQTSASGSFSIRVMVGSYNVGSFNPGMGQSKEVQAAVDSSGNVYVDGSSTVSTGSSGGNPFILRMSKPNYTITGRVTDGTSAIGNASVFAYRTDGPGHIDAMSDSSSGNYTLYVDNGSWKVGAFVPGFGPMAEQSVTVAGANQSDINFAPSSSQSFSILSGNIYEDSDSGNDFDTGEGITGAVIRLMGTGGSNESVSGSDGAFSIRVPSASGYSITDIFHPSYGRIGALANNSTAIGSLNLSASTTQNIKVPKLNTITVNIKDSDGNLLVVSKAFIDLFDTTRKLGNRMEITNASSTSIQIATSTSPTVRVYIQGVPPSNIAISSDSGTTAVSAAGVLTVDSSAETVKAVVNTSTANMSTISGTVYHTASSTSNLVGSAWIQFIDETNGVHFGAQTSSSGFYSIKAANGTYQVLVSKPGYVGSPVTVTVSSATTQNFTLSSANLTISGRVLVGGTGAADAFVRAEKVGGGQAITRADTSGNYTLNVTGGNWRVFAAAEGYAEGSHGSTISVSGSISGINVNLSTAVTLQTKLATSNTFTDTSASSFNDSTVGVKIELDSSTLGTSGNSSYITAKETSNFPNTTSVNIVGNKGKDINAYSGGSQIKNLQSGKTATVELTYMKSDLATSSVTTAAGVSSLKVVSYSEDKRDWEALSTVPTYKDASDNIVTPNANLSNVSSISFTAVGTHFSAYALSAPIGVLPPDTPTTVTATAGAAGSGAITISWTSSTGATGYYVYRDTDSGGSFPLLTSTGTETSYQNTGLTNGVTYYYRVSAFKSGGAAESSASSAVNTRVEIISGGGLILNPGGGGGGSSSYVPPVVSTVPTTLATTQAPKTTSQTAQPSKIISSVSPVFTKDLVKGAKNNDVKRLQELLSADKEIYPEALKTGLFGKITEQAVLKFQLKYGVIKKSTDGGAGKLGPKTRAKLQEVFGGSATAGTVLTPVTPSGVIPSASAVANASPKSSFLRALFTGSRGSDVKNLQKILNSDPETIITETGAGSPGNETDFFGALTNKAVQKLQEKYKIAMPGEEGYGRVGPKTRAKLSEIQNTQGN